MPPNTMHPADPVVPSSVTVPPEAYVTTALTPETPTSGSRPLSTSTSSAEPTGGVTIPCSRTVGGFSRGMGLGQLTADSMLTLAPVAAALAVALHPVLVPDEPTSLVV